MKKMDNKGFTLVELLAVLIILIAIMSIAIPSISSSLERSKDKQNEARKKVLESAAELYVTDHKNNIENNSCCISLEELKSENYIDEDATKDADGKVFNGNIEYNKVDNSYTFSNIGSCDNKCIN